MQLVREVNNRNMAKILDTLKILLKPLYWDLGNCPLYRDSP